MSKWRFNGIEIDVNPTFVSKRPSKHVSYRTTIDGKEVRVLPLRNSVETFIEVHWQRLSEEWKNRFHDWNVADKEIVVQSHLSDPRDTWTVVIDEMTVAEINSLEPAWEVALVLRVVDGINDPIIRQDFDSAPFLFVVENNTNRVVHDARLFITPMDITPMEEMRSHELRIRSHELRISSAFLANFPDIITVGSLMQRHLSDEELELLEYPDNEVLEIMLSQHTLGYGIFGMGAYGQSIYGGLTTQESYPQLLLEFDISRYSEITNPRFHFKGVGLSIGEGGEENVGLEVYFYDHIEEQFNYITTTYEDDMYSLDVLPKYLGSKLIVLLKTTIGSDLTSMAKLLVDTAIFTMSVVKGSMVNLSITQTYLNILKNPSFEDGFANWHSIPNDWNLDYIRFSDGSICVSTNELNSPIYQDVYFPEGERLTVMCVAMGDEGTSLEMAVDYLTDADDVLASTSETYTLTSQHETYWFSSEDPSPAGTRKVRFKIEKVAGEGSIYVDQAMVQLRQSSGVPEWTAYEHDTLTYIGDINNGDVLRINLIDRSVDINGIDNVYHKVSGNFFTIPIGRSMLVISEETSAINARVVLRYDELWD